MNSALSLQFKAQCGANLLFAIALLLIYSTGETNRVVLSGAFVFNLMAFFTYLRARYNRTCAKL